MCVDSSRQKVPFGICQIGKAFRNEVTPRNFTFRSREFEQMELEFFITPDEAIASSTAPSPRGLKARTSSEPQPNWGWEMWHHYWEKQRVDYYDSIGLGADVLDYHWQKPDELAHYARACVDILFKFPFGTEELEGIAARGDFDLSQHQKHSGKPQEVFDEELRAAAGRLDEAAKAGFVASVQEEWAARRGQKRQARGRARRALAKDVLREALQGPLRAARHRALGRPRPAGPGGARRRLSRGRKDRRQWQDENARCCAFIRASPRSRWASSRCSRTSRSWWPKRGRFTTLLKRHLHCFYDETGTIGRRYARQDEAGTPFGVTIDFETLGENGGTEGHRHPAPSRRRPAGTGQDW